MDRDLRDPPFCERSSICSIAAAVIGAGVAGIAGSAIQGSASKSAAQTQANAETTAANDQLQQQQINTANLAPYNKAGQAATTNLQNMGQFSYGAFNAPAAFNFDPTEANLEQTPGYQFNLDQGLKATQNSAAARGLGDSGAALKGAASYASGLADTTYQNQFTNALNSYNSNYSNSLGAYTTNYNTAQNQFETNLGVQQNLASLGENAAAETGQMNTQLAGNIGQTAVGSANAIAAGQIGSANAIASGLNSAAGAGTNALLFNQFLSPTLAGVAGQAGGGGVATPADLEGLV